MKRQKFRFASRCRDDVGEFQIAKIEVALAEDGTIQTDIEIERLHSDGSGVVRYPGGAIAFAETYTLPDEQETVSCWKVLEY